MCSAAALSGPPEHAITIAERPRSTPSASHAAAPRAAIAAAAAARSRAARDAFDLSADFALLDRFAFVRRLFPAAEAEFHFHAAAFEVGPQRHERQTLLLQRAGQAPDLPGVEQQLSVTVGLVLREERAPVVGRDLDVRQPSLTVLQSDEAVAEHTSVQPDALDLGPRQDDPGLDPVHESIFVKRPAVGRDLLDAFVRHELPDPWPSRRRTLHEI